MLAQGLAPDNRQMVYICPQHILATIKSIILTNTNMLDYEEVAVFSRRKHDSIILVQFRLPPSETVEFYPSYPFEYLENDGIELQAKNPNIISYFILGKEFPKGWQPEAVKHQVKPGNLLNIATPLQIPPVDVAAGSPAQVLPTTATVPFDLVALKADAQIGDGFYQSTPWMGGQFLNLRDGTQAYWDGANWQQGTAVGIPLRGFTAGIPGTPNPPGANLPQDFADLQAHIVVGNGHFVQPAWTAGQYVTMANGDEAYWDGRQWIQGRVPIILLNILEGTPGTTQPSIATMPPDLLTLKAHGQVGDATYASRPWLPGEYIVLGDASEAYWDGSAWQVGKAPQATIPIVDIFAGTPGQPFPSMGELFQNLAEIKADFNVGDGHYAHGAWTVGQYFVLANGQEVYYDGTQWQHGRVPAPAQPTITDVIAGTPGHFEPRTISVPANLATLKAHQDIGDATYHTGGNRNAWADGQYVVLGDGSFVRWSGATNGWITDKVILYFTGDSQKDESFLHAGTFSPTVTLDRNINKTGNSSYAFNQNTNPLYLATSNLPTNGEFTFSCWLYWDEFPSNANLLLIGRQGSLPLSLNVQNDGTLNVFDGARSLAAPNLFPVMQPQQWYHLAFYLHNEKVRGWFNGISINIDIDGFQRLPYLNRINSGITIGLQNTMGTLHSAIHVDEIIISLGQRYTGNFTP